MNNRLLYLFLFMLKCLVERRIKMNKQILEKKKTCEQLLSNEQYQSNKISNYRLLLLIMFIITLIIYFNTSYKTISLIILSLLIITFIILILIHHKIDINIKNINNYLSIIKEYEMRTSGSWKEFKDNGTDIYKENEFTKDFNIIGNNSLFQLLNVSRSIGGKKTFIEQLTKPDNKEKSIIETEEAVSELKDNFNIVLELQNKLISIDNINDTNFSEYSNLLEENVTPNKKVLLFAIITSIISDIILILGIFNIIPFIFFILVMIIQTIISYIYLYFHNETFENITNCTRKLSTLKNIYEYIVTLDFKSNKLNKIQKEIEEGYTTFKELVKINDLNNLRSNFITNVIFNTIMSLNIITIYKYSKLLTNKKEIIESIKSLEQLESILSLSTICFIKKDICIPTISKDTKISFTNIKHPLLEEDKCISNNFKTNKGINIITGTNMSGKSSFMKTIGINLILMEAGTYVEATSFTSSLMKIFSSIKVEDDINNNISTFYGELLRIKKILDYSKKNNESLVIFIDEIFKGTNYNDRIYGAKEIIKKLSELDAITFITTHDYELCDNKNVNNYHFEENYKDTNITFDYKLKEGKCMTTNAKYLMEKLGIIEGDK